MNSGKVLICLIVAVAVLASSVAWYHQASRGTQVLELWGADNAYLIRCAEQIQLAANGQEAELGRAPGIAHARQALIVDASYDWSASEPIPTPTWSHHLKFAGEGREFELRFDLAQRVLQGGDTSHVRMGPTLASGLKVFFDEQLGH
jgi:hypothetical protein